MTEATKGSGKSITSVPGLQVEYLSTIATGYTFTTRFGTVKAAFFQPGASVPAAGDLPFVTLSLSGSVITFTISGGITSGYLEAWGE